jgi:hypothetical protein
LVRLVSAVVVLFFFDLNALSAEAASVAETIETPPAPISVALPPLAMSEPLIVRVRKWRKSQEVETESVVLFVLASKQKPHPPYLWRERDFPYLL